MPIKWFGGLFKKKVDMTMDRRFDEAGRAIATHAKQLVGIQYPPASSPGEPPRRRTGRLQGSISHQVLKKPWGTSVQVYAGVEYGEYLDTGTRHGLAARPWTKRSYRESVQKVKKILLDPIK
jgi:hypothetical protein